MILQKKWKYNELEKKIKKAGCFDTGKQMAGHPIWHSPITMKKVKAIIERAGDGSYSVYMDADDISYLITGTGKNAEEAINSFKINYDDMKRYYAEEGKEFEEVEFVYEYDMASFLSYYCKAFSLAGLSRITGVNQGQLSHYVTGHRAPSERTKLKIQNSIQEFAKELSLVHFL